MKAIVSICVVFDKIYLKCLMNNRNIDIKRGFSVNNFYLVT